MKCNICNREIDKDEMIVIRDSEILCFYCLKKDKNFKNADYFNDKERALNNYKLKKKHTEFLIEYYKWKDDQENILNKFDNQLRKEYEKCLEELNEIIKKLEG